MADHCPYHIGQKVTLRIEPKNGRALAEGLRFGDVYTITGMYVLKLSSGKEYVMLQFAEIEPIPHPRRPPQGGWHWRSFRPVTDISVFQQMLNTTKTPELVGG